MKRNYDYMTGAGNKIIINCVNCLNKLKVPLDKGKIKVTCPVCKKEFIFNPNSIIHTIRQIIMFTKALILNIKIKKIPLIIYKLKAYFYKNKRKFIISFFIALIMMFIFIVSLLILTNLHDKEPNINIQGKPGPVAIL
mgnify:CR=1 FL=1